MREIEIEIKYGVQCVQKFGVPKYHCCTVLLKIWLLWHFALQ